VPNTTYTTKSISAIECMNNVGEFDMEYIPYNLFIRSKLSNLFVRRFSRVMKAMSVVVWCYKYIKGLHPVEVRSVCMLSYCARKYICSYCR
jgi:hypothetical protein